MNSKLIYLIYTYILYPLAFVVLQLIRPFCDGKLREMIDDKNNLSKSWHFNSDSFRADKKSLWIHAASGEIEYAKPVIREIKSLEPDLQIIVTYSSPSAKKFLSKMKDVDAWGPLPWDFKSTMSDWIQKFNIATLLVARTDLWTQQATIAKKKGLNVYLFSATFAQNSSRLSGLTKYLTLYSLNKIDGIFVVSEDDKKNIASLPISTPIKVLGDSRFDQVLHRLENPTKIRSELKPLGPTFILGSIWPEDEQKLLRLLPKLKLNGWSFILAPHEIHTSHIDSLQSQLKSIGLNSALYTKATSITQSDVLIVDVVGILAEIYQWGDIAFVGGSFKKQVHSVMEPLAAGLPVLVGPHHLNNREAVLMQSKKIEHLSFVTSANDPEEWLPFFELLKDANKRKKIKEGIITEISKLTGSSKNIAQIALDAKIKEP